MSQVPIDSIVGLPFSLLPGTPAEHSIVGEYDGQRIRAAAVETVWNDMLLMDAVEGPGYYARWAGRLEHGCLEIAERLYGVSAEDGLKRWLTLPKLRKACEWGKETS